MKILRIAMDGEEYPNYTLTNAFTSTFNEVKTIWWQQTADLNNDIISEVTNNKYDAVFIQIQADGIISEDAARSIYENSVGFNWTGDVRTNIDWYIKLGKYLITLFTNETDVIKMRSLGLRADYLQIGYDDKYYYPSHTECHNNIVFCANYYQNNNFPLTKYRVDIANALKQNFGDRFNLYGKDWHLQSLSAEKSNVNNEQEAQIYRTSAIAINCSHFNYIRYSSDRLLRELSCGAFVLSHNYDGYNKDFEDGKHFRTFKDIKQLIELCHYYLDRPIERKIISEQGCKEVINTANWKNRINEFSKLIIKYK
jgi:glycosyltransferase involved in cell wall biosynthesis